MHPQWAARLREETGIDTGFRRCGGIYLADEHEEPALAAAMNELQRRGIEASELSHQTLRELEPGIAQRPGAASATWLLPDESQLRNPWHLRALLAACAKRGVEIEEHASIDDFLVVGNRIDSVSGRGKKFVAGQVVIATGAWTGVTFQNLGFELRIKPIRGQILLLRSEVPLRRIVNLGPRYLVPRGDGRILVGSTEEDVGFEKRTTDEAIAAWRIGVI